MYQAIVVAIPKGGATQSVQLVPWTDVPVLGAAIALIAGAQTEAQKDLESEKWAEIHTAIRKKP